MAHQLVRIEARVAKRIVTIILRSDRARKTQASFGWAGFIVKGKIKRNRKNKKHDVCLTHGKMRFVFVCWEWRREHIARRSNPTSKRRNQAQGFPGWIGSMIRIPIGNERSLRV